MKHHDLYIQCDILLLPDVFEHFQSICFEIFELDPAIFLITPGSAYQTVLVKAKVE